MKTTIIEKIINFLLKKLKKHFILIYYNKDNKRNTTLSTNIKDLGKVRAILVSIKNKIK